LTLAAFAGWALSSDCGVVKDGGHAALHLGALQLSRELIDR
jgi:hypothetical protein